MSDQAMIEITVNGDVRSTKKGITVRELLEELEINSRAIAVEINQKIQSRDQFELTQVEAGDVLEIVTLVGGG